MFVFVCRILVGAPKANDSNLPNIIEPGATFQCKWQYRNNCSAILIDQNGMFYITHIHCIIVGYILPELMRYEVIFQIPLDNLL